MHVPLCVSRMLVSLLVPLLMLPCPSWAGFLPTVVDRSAQNTENIIATRVTLENKIVTQYLKATGKSQESIDNTLSNLTPEQRRKILTVDIPAYEANEGGLKALMILLAIPFFILSVGASSRSDDCDRRNCWRTHPHN